MGIDHVAMNRPLNPLIIIGMYRRVVSPCGSQGLVPWEYRAMQDNFWEIELDVAISWQLQGLRGCSGSGSGSGSVLHTTPWWAITVQWSRTLILLQQQLNFEVSFFD